MADAVIDRPAPPEIAARTDPHPGAARGRLRRRLARFGPPVLTGALLAAAFPPFDLGLLAFVAPVPLLVRWMGAERARAAALDGFVAGVAFFSILLVWTWHFGAVAYVPFVLVLSLYWAGAGAVVGALAARGAAGPWSAAAAWVVFEALRGRWPLGGFSWGEVGYAFHDVPAMRSLAAWGGVLAVSFVAVVVAGLLAVALSRWRTLGVREARGALVMLLAVVVVVGAAHAVRPDTTPTRPLRVAILQGNDRDRDLTPAERTARFLPESHFELAASVERPVDLVVFPESSLDEDPRIDPFLEARLVDLAARLDTAVLANAAVEIEGGARLHNTNFLYDPDGTLQGTYIKQHLVPYGEYVPGRQYLGFIDELDQIPRDHAPGNERRVFDVAGAEVGTLICFESAFTEIARSYARDGAEVLVVSTNNRSFRRSANSAQHVAIGQMRAAETGRPVVHAAISGTSAFIEADGDVVSSTDLFERDVLEGTVVGRTGRTPYVVVGDWVVLLAALVLAGAAWRVRNVGGFAASRKRP